MAGQAIWDTSRARRELWRKACQAVTNHWGGAGSVRVDSQGGRWVFQAVAAASAWSTVTPLRAGAWEGWWQYLSGRQAIKDAQQSRRVGLVAPAQQPPAQLEAGRPAPLATEAKVGQGAGSMAVGSCSLTIAVRSAEGEFEEGGTAALQAAQRGAGGGAHSCRRGGGGRAGSGAGQL